jgi:hypothetical protein
VQRMHFINSSSLAPDVSDWLATSRHPRILQVFEHACNLINERREVISIVTPQIGNGPFNLVVADNICFLDNFNLGSPISISPAQLILGSLIIRKENAKLWNPQPDWEMLHIKRDDVLNQIKQLPITNYVKHGGFDCLPLNHLSLPYVQSLISSLSSALAKEDISNAKKITSKLAGLGSGLTPSGDDSITGALYAAWILHPPDVSRVLAQEIADLAAPLTTSLSAAWLKAAGKGEAGIVWHEFFDALLSKDWARIEESKKKILAVGATSGADALAGFTGVFASWMEKAGFSHG